MPLKSLNSNAIRGEFARQIESGQDDGFVSNICYMNKASDQFTETYKWLGDIDGFREWIGSRKVTELRDYDLIVSNKKYENTLSVFADEIEFDKTTQVNDRLQGIGALSTDHWAELTTNLILAGSSTVGYDGAFFFSTSHSWGNSGTYSNLLSVTANALPVGGAGYQGTTTDPSPEQLALAILRGIQQLYTFRSDTGRPLNQNAKSFLVEVPVSFMGAASVALANDMLSLGRQNPLKSTGFNIGLHVNPRLTWTDRFAIFRTDGTGNTRPFICQEMSKIRYTMLDENSDLYHNEDRMEFGAKTWRGVGYGLPQHACLVTLV